jgi:hypothetical protein
MRPIGRTGLFLVFLLGPVRRFCRQDRERLAKILTVAGTGLEEVGRDGGFADAAEAALGSASEMQGGVSANPPEAAPEATQAAIEETNCCN